MALFDQLEYHFEPVDVGIFFTLLLLEGVLSFDNAAVIAALVRRLPKHQQRKALFYGLAGAYAMRVTAILLAGFLIQNAILRVIGGGYLLFLTTRHLMTRRQPHEPGSVVAAAPAKTFLGLSAFWATIVTVEAADLVFALDQIVVAVAFTKKIPLIILAALTAILALRLSAIFMIKLMDWFPPLETLAYVAVGWVGLKLVATEAIHYLGYTDFGVPKLLSVGVTLSLLVAPLLVKFVLDRVRGRRHALPAVGASEPEESGK